MVKSFIKNEIVLVISFVLAVISIVFVPVDAAYIGYIDFRTLAILFCLMVVMAGLQKLMVFRQIGERLIGRVSSTRGISLILILLCFFFSMFITNDVALLTFVPFTVVVFTMAKITGELIPVIVLETVAANLGSMMLPMGNPQNLYLYSLTDMSIGAFVLFMLPLGAISLLLILLLCFFMVKKQDVTPEVSVEYTRSRGQKIRLVGYLILFVMSILVVARALDYRIGFVILLVTVLLMDRETIVKIDYSLLFTFTFLFIFIGNLKRIDAIANMLSSIVVGNEVITGVVASQFISNVPAAILLSGFTNDIRGLIIGTNLGGLGTLIASMASLISFKQYGYIVDAKKGRYVRVFTVVNVLLLVIAYGAFRIIY